MKIALVGNQNCGKSTLFNVLTGANQKIGNWPGVTIERKSGIVKGGNHELIDLPGIYSLFFYSEEERISRDFLLNEEIDLIINVIDSTSLERSLYLTTQLKELDIPLILVLNMMDLAIKKGVVIEKEILEKELNVSVVEVSALKNIGIDELIEEIDKDISVCKLKVFDSYLEQNIDYISKYIEGRHKKFYSVKILEENDVGKKYFDRFKGQLDLIKSKYGTDLVEMIASQRYDFVEKVRDKCVEVKSVKQSVSDKIDKIFLNKWLALPIFFIIMFIVYYLSIGLAGNYTSNVVDYFTEAIRGTGGNYLKFLGVSSWLNSLIVDAIIPGVCSVLAFVPQIMMLFLCVAVLENTGYMSRIAFFLDMVFKKIGLSGKTLVPFIVGSGCSVPGILSTRIIEDKKEREMSVALTPFIPCSAKLPIIALFGSYFFSDNNVIFCFSLYLMSIFIVLILSVILKKTVYKGEETSFISELPEYKVPNVKYVFRDTLEKTFLFIKRAGTIIFLSSIIVWFSLSFSFNLEYGVDIENSILASVGKVLSFVFYPVLGEFSWECTVSSIQGLIAKEHVVSSMSIIANMGSKFSDEKSVFRGEIFGFFSPSTAYAYVAFNLFSAPCFGAIGAMRKELGSSKKVSFVVAMQIIVAWIVAVLVRSFGLFVGV